MSKENMRQDFEEWCCNADDGPLVDPVWIAYFDAETNEYGLNQIQRDWISWQASRAALCVELPEKYRVPDCELEQHCNAAIDQCRSAIESTGVRTR